MSRAARLLGEVKSEDGLWLTSNEYNDSLKEIESIRKAYKNLFTNASDIRRRLSKEKDKEGVDALDKILDEIKRRSEENDDFYKEFNI